MRVLIEKIISLALNGNKSESTRFPDSSGQMDKHLLRGQFPPVAAADTGLLPIAIRGFTLLIYGYKSESSHIKVEYYDNSNSVPLQSKYIPP